MPTNLLEGAEKLEKITSEMHQQDLLVVAVAAFPKGTKRMNWNSVEVEHQNNFLAVDAALVASFAVVAASELGALSSLVNCMRLDAAVVHSSGWDACLVNASYWTERVVSFEYRVDGDDDLVAVDYAG